MTRIWICGPDRIKSRVLRIQTAGGIFIGHLLTCDHDARQGREGLTGGHQAPHVSEVLGLDTVVTIHLAGVEETAQTEPIQADGEHVPGERWSELQGVKCTVMLSEMQVVK